MERPETDIFEKKKIDDRLQLKGLCHQIRKACKRYSFKGPERT
jgi:hypothetical protein